MKPVPDVSLLLPDTPGQFGLASADVDCSFKGVHSPFIQHSLFSSQRVLFAHLQHKL